MSRARLLILLLAIGCAVLAAVLARGFIGRPTTVTVSSPANPPAAAQVLVAARDLAMGERLNSLSMEWRDWPAENISPGMITQADRPNALEELSTARVRLPMLTYEPITEGKIVKPEDRGYLSAVLPEGMRAISVAISEQTAASGFILPNDRVDVIVTRKFTTQDGNVRSAYSATVVSNVRVLAINQSFGQDQDATSMTNLETAVLELDPQQAEAVSMGEGAGEISLSLRSLADSGKAGPGGDKPVLNRRNAGGSGPTIIRYGINNSPQM